MKNFLTVVLSPTEVAYQLVSECSDYSAATQESIVRWLLGEDLERFETLNSTQRAIALQSIEYRYGILRQRYLGLGAERAYRNLIARLGRSVLLKSKIRTYIALSRDRQQTVLDLLQEVIQDILLCDRYMQQQIAQIAKYTQDTRLRNALLMSSLEEYCTRPIRNQPLLVYRLFNYIRRRERGGITKVPTGSLVKLVSAEASVNSEDRPVSFLFLQAVAKYEESQTLEEQMFLQTAVQQEFSSYLAENVSQQAVQWLELYLQGKSQKAIALAMNLKSHEVYRLREKVSYHAKSVFALKKKPELVASWLQTAGV